MSATERVTVAVTLAAAVGSGLMAGVFAAFSTAVMPALRRLPAAEGMSAMQAVNVAASLVLAARR